MSQPLNTLPLPQRLRAYVKHSGPGWLQSGLALGGGSLASSLYLGVLAGYTMLWLQPVAMLFGIVMLSALGYVTMATGQRPFETINRHINPVLGWAWVLASLMASIIWAFPQFSLAVASIQQNLAPGLLGHDGPLGRTGGTALVAAGLFLLSGAITWSYDRGSHGVRIFEIILKIMVALVVLSFAGVVVRLAMVPGSIPWRDVAAGFIPNPSLMFRPAAGFEPFLADLPETSRVFWTRLIVNQQQNVMAAAMSSAVGINMTYLFAYSMLRRKWGTEYHGLMKFDLVTGMLIPFMLATSFVLIAAASQFYTRPQTGFSEYLEARGLIPAAEQAPAAGDAAVDGTGADAGPEASDRVDVLRERIGARQMAQYEGFLKDRIAFEHGPGLADAGADAAVLSLSSVDHLMASMLVTRDAFDLAAALRPLLGDLVSHLIFGVGVLAMALSSITLMMLISGCVVCEVLGLPQGGRVFRLGSLLAGLGMLGPFFWAQASFWLAIPASVMALILLPIAYVTFLAMMNNRRLLGPHMPTGRRRVGWNVLMGVSVLGMGSTSLYMLWLRNGPAGIAVLGGFLVLIAAGHWVRLRREKKET